MTEWGWAVKFEPRDLWVGLFWDREEIDRPWGDEIVWRFYLCVLPMFPLVVRVTKNARSDDRVERREDLAHQARTARDTALSEAICNRLRSAANGWGRDTDQSVMLNQAANYIEELVSRLSPLQKSTIDQRTEEK